MRTTKTLRRLVVVSATVTLLSACGGSDGDATTDGGSTTTAADGEVATDDGTAGAVTCPTDAEVSDAVGSEVVGDPPTPGRCGYYSADGTASVGIDVEDPSSRTLADIERNQPVSPIEGLGDEAYAVETPGGTVQVGVFADGAHVLVTLDGVAVTSVAAAQAVYGLYAGA